MLGHSNLASGDSRATTMLDKKGLNGSPVKKPPPPYLSRSTLKRHLRRTYGRRPMELVKRYFRSMFDLADYASYAAFLLRCRDMRIVPRCYRVECPGIKYTRHVLRILDECSYRLMLADLDYHRLRKLQLSSFLERVHERLEKIVSPEDLNALVVLAKAKYDDIIHTSRVKQLGMFEELLKEYGIGQEKKDAKEEKKGSKGEEEGHDNEEEEDDNWGEEDDNEEEECDSKEEDDVEKEDVNEKEECDSKEEDDVEKEDENEEEEYDSKEEDDVEKKDDNEEEEYDSKEEDDVEKKDDNEEEEYDSKEEDDDEKEDDNE
ncbi:uncharacterized protein LOC144160012 [Haemaphysalis longicornis]